MGYPEAGGIQGVVKKTSWPLVVVTVCKCRLVLRKECQKRAFEVWVEAERILK